MINTWHGSLGIKKNGNEMTNCIKKKDLFNYFANQVDYVTSNSTFLESVLSGVFYNNGKYIKTGNPRNDILFKDNYELKNQILKKYNLDNNIKIALYAPTFRDFSLGYDVTKENIYSLDYENLCNALNDKFEGNWLIFNKFHPRQIEIRNILLKQHNNSIIDVTTYPDIQELLAISDIVITDYSSCIYDFVLTRKPGFIFATDIERYNNARGFYYPLETTPFPIALNNKELIKNIKNFELETYKQKVEQFLIEKGCVDDGHASERVVDLIKHIIQN